MPHFGAKQQIGALIGSSPRCHMHALPRLANRMLGEHRAMRWVFA
jgi:hypothetical protein